ncbi:APC family permease [Brevibacterium linens]|uniref:APC family permease n=1 Tax=Brevibacterium linens TaxID=1703 RepID=UPI003BF57263
MSIDIGIKMTDLSGQHVHEFQKKLGLPDVIAQSLSVIAPAMSGAFLTYLAATKAGGATPVSFLLGALGMLCVGSVVALFAGSLSSSGSMYTYLSKGGNRATGFIGGWAYVSAYLIFGSGVLSGFGFFIAQLVEMLSGAEIDWYWFTLLGIVIIAALNFFNIAVSTKNQLIFLVVSMAVMIIVSAIVIGIGSPDVSVVDGETRVDSAGQSWDFAAFWPPAAGVPWIGVFFGMSFAMLSFVGSESSAALSEETRDSKRNIPRAVLGSILVAGIFYLVVSYATSIGFGVEQAKIDWPSSATGLAGLAPNTLTAALVLAAAGGASLFCALGLHTASSRVLFAMGREGVLPKKLGRLHPHWNTPWNSMIFVVVVWILLIGGSVLIVSRAAQVELAGGLDDYVTGGVFVFTLLLNFGTPVVMFVYLMLGIAGIVHGFRNKLPKFIAAGFGASVFAVVAIFGGLYFSFVPEEPGGTILMASRLIPWVGMLIVIIGCILAIWTKRKRAQAWEGMGRVFDDL